MYRKKDSTSMESLDVSSRAGRDHVMREGGFTVVGRRQGRRRLSAKALAAQQAAAHPMPSEAMGDEAGMSEASMSEALDQLDERLEGAVSELRVSPLWRRLLHLLEPLRPIDHLVSFGIGSFIVIRCIFILVLLLVNQL